MLICISYVCNMYIIYTYTLCNIYIIYTTTANVTHAKNVLHTTQVCLWEGLQVWLVVPAAHAGAQLKASYTTSLRPHALVAEGLIH